MAKISQTATGEPEFGLRHDNDKQRFLVGWRHQDDTEQGLQTGKIWGWVSEPPEKFQVFDEDFNRSEIFGEVRFCGVANFTMVRMFHPYWTIGNRVPRDGDIGDKRCCRERGKKLTRRYRIAHDLPVEEDPQEFAKKKKKRTKKKKQQDTSLTTTTDEGVQEIQTRRQDSLPGTLEMLAGGSADDPMFVSEGETDDTKEDLRDSLRLGLEEILGAGTKQEPIDVDVD